MNAKIMKKELPLLNDSDSDGSAWAAGAKFITLFTGVILLEGLDLGTA